MSESTNQGFSKAQAKRWEYGIIGFCILSMAFIFQPFSQTLFFYGVCGRRIGGLGL